MPLVQIVHLTLPLLLKLELPETEQLVIILVVVGAQNL